MGWAKYYEDNVSIYVGRMAMADYEPVICCDNPKKQIAADNKANKENPEMKPFKPSKANNRKGLMLSFHKNIDSHVMRRMQLNGWWWSNASSCWCNNDTIINREYAKNMMCYGASVSVAA